MKIKDLFDKSIERNIEGVVTIGNETEFQKKQELEEYVCTDETVRSFRTFFRKYRESINAPTDKIGVWVTGFFGSGKSHFLKTLGYLLENEVVDGKESIEYFQEKIADEMVMADIRLSAKTSNKVVLFNIDSKAKSDAKHHSQAIMDIMLRCFNESIGYCGSLPWVADMERSLDSEGLLKSFIDSYNAISQKEWSVTRQKALLNRDYIVKALAETRTMTEESARKFVDDQTTNYTNSTEEFAKIVNDYCTKEKTRVVFLMDEVGQFVGDNTQLMLNLQTCVEDLGKFCKGRAWVVVTSQQELKAMIDSTKDKQQDFSKIQGRFDTRILLSGANADEVIKRRILEKKKAVETPLGNLYEANSSKLSNLILFPSKPTWSGYKDTKDFIEVYPFVSYQFELLQKVFESIREHGMSEGRHLSQNERSLLSAFQESAKKCCEDDINLLVPFDSFYSTLEQFIDYDIKTVFSNAERRAGLDAFSIRVLKVLFMVKHVKEMPATIERIATLMVGSIDEDKAALKGKILESLSRLEEETLIQKNGEEYDFLTNAEQDVNKQINSTNYNEGEVKRTILDIIYDRVLENNKLRYDGRYDFALNRYVDDESKGATGNDNITIKVMTQFSNMRDPSEFSAESIQSNSIVVNLTEGAFVDELIKANKISTFKRNNSATMTAQLTEIMAKKMAENSDRIKRAEDIIKQMLRTAPIYLNGQPLDIKEKDGKDRLTDALKEKVKQDYYKLSLVQYFYNDQKAIAEAMISTNKLFDDDISKDGNSAAYDEIINRIKTDKSLGKKTTVKGLMDFTKKPYGWREYDILGMTAELWHRNKLQFRVHDNVIDEKDATFRNDYIHKNNIDTVVVSVQQKIDEQVLYQVKRIMNDIYSVSIVNAEPELKNGVESFFNSKKAFLENLHTKYGSSFAGSKAATEIYNLFSEVLKSGDPSTMFNTIIEKRDELDAYNETLEQIETFYKDGSSQQKSFNEAKEICEWYQNNYMLIDLSNMKDNVERMTDIINLDMPFANMTELSQLVFNSGEIKDKIIVKKYHDTKLKLEADAATIKTECEEAVKTEISDEKRDKLKSKAEEIAKQYEQWGTLLTKESENMDSFVNASASSVKNFRDFVEMILADDQKPSLRSKSVRIADYIPVANKKIKSASDIDKALATIKEKLIQDLKENDEINLS